MNLRECVAEIRKRMEDADGELCGVLIFTSEPGEFEVVDCPNVHPVPGAAFMPSPEWFVDGKRETVAWVWHTHVGVVSPSAADVAACEAFGVPWLVLGREDGESAVIVPEASVVGLLGRPWESETGCWDFVRHYLQAAYYLDAIPAEVPSPWPPESPEWFNSHPASKDFRRVGEHEPVRDGDVLVLNVWSPNGDHLAVVRGDWLYDHMEGKPSTRRPWLRWRKRVVGVYRHHELDW